MAQVTAVIGDIINLRADEMSDPTISRFASALMAGMAQMVEEKVKQEHFPFAQQAKIVEITK